MCNIPEDLNHYLFVCKKFDEEMIQLQEKLEEILHREDANHIGNVDFKVLTGMVEEISREAQRMSLEPLWNSLGGAQRGFKLKSFKKVTPEPFICTCVT